MEADDIPRAMEGLASSDDPFKQSFRERVHDREQEEAYVVVAGSGRAKLDRRSSSVEDSWQASA